MMPNLALTWKLDLLLGLGLVPVLVRLLSFCWIKGDQKNHLSIKGLLSITGIKPTLFQNSTSKVPAMQAYATITS